MWISRSAWLPAALDDLTAAAMRVATLPAWHGAIAAIDAPDAVDLRNPLARGRLTLAGARGPVPASWRVRRRVRDTVHLEVVPGRGRPLELLVSCSPWDGGTAVELGVARDGARGWLEAGVTGRRLDASLAALHRRTAGAHPAVRPRPVARPLPLTSPGGGLIP